MKKIIIQNSNNQKFEKYEKEFIPFDKSIQGKSGAIIGYLKNDPRTVIKFNYYNNKPKYDYFFKTTSDTCIQINNKINEVFINNILNNLESLNIFTTSQIKSIKPYILELKESGFADKGTYILLPLIGFEYKLQNINNENNVEPSTKSGIIDHPTKYITNLTDVMVFNHKIFLDKAVKTNRFDIIELYDEYLSLMLKKYFDVLKLLQDKLGYINTDLKLNNIFVEKQLNNNLKFIDLKNYGFNIDFQLKISDLEKSIYIINNIKTFTIPNNPLKVKVAEKIGYGLVYRVRYQCISDFEKQCPKLKSIDYDIIFMILNILVILHRNNIFPNMKNHLKKTLQLIKTILNINSNDLELMLNIISKNIFKIDKKVQYYLNIIITKICKKMI